MRFLRTLSLPRLIAVCAAVVVILVVGGGAIAMAARGSGPKPPAKPLAQALHDALAAPEPAGVTARIKFTNKLFPSGALTGQVGSALMSGADGRLWLTNDGRGRLELQSSSGDVQIVWNQKQVTVYDASSNTVYTRALPQHQQDKQQSKSGGPTLAEITTFLTDLGGHWNVSDATPTNIAGQPAYSVSVSPKHSGGLLGSLGLAWDAAHGVPLRVAIYAQGSSTPVLALEATDVSYGAVPSSAVDISPPAGAKKSPLVPAQLGKERGAKNGRNKGSEPTGVPAVQKAVGFKVVAPDSLVGLPRKTVQLAGPDGKTVLLVYGEGLGAIVVAEHRADTANNHGPLAGLPQVSLDGATGHELATQLGTILSWQRDGVGYVLAGSMPSSAAETAARSLR